MPSGYGHGYRRMRKAHALRLTRSVSGGDTARFVLTLTLTLKADGESHSSSFQVKAISCNRRKPLQMVLTPGSPSDFLPKKPLD
ncbi:hypothetical protein SAMD00079811_74900 [Scytonema sp. HK-05]|nr:hypothetical protein SAMD00079811_74900 [Scytonema sp. HK-05]